jgi:hypothetical protein
MWVLYNILISIFFFNFLIFSLLFEGLGVVELLLNGTLRGDGGDTKKKEDI